MNQKGKMDWNQPGSHGTGVLQITLTDPWKAVLCSSTYAVDVLKG